MAFDSMAEVIQMGTHGVYVWSTYGISVVALGGLCLVTLRTRAQRKQQLKKRFQRELSR